MQIDETQITHIKKSFELMQSKEELLILMNEVKTLIYGEKAIPFTLRQITWHANPKLGGKRYTQFTIRKKSGKSRSINAPVSGLKSIQKVLSFILQTVFEPHKAATGFVRGKSIVDNAKVHVGNRYVYNIDLKDFFPSIDQARVWKCLQLKPFNLSKEASVELIVEKEDDFSEKYLKSDEQINLQKTSGGFFAETSFCKFYAPINIDINKDVFVVYVKGELDNRTKIRKPLHLVNNPPIAPRLELANLIASLCCTEMEVERQDESRKWITVKRNVLPQGAPTSPVITNIICQRIDFLLTGVAKRFGLRYSRYADDITFSSLHNVYQPNGEFVAELERIITEQGFFIKESKTRLQKEGQRQEVTGLVVNERVNVTSKYIKQLRMWLYYWEQYGYERAYDFFLKQYVADKGHVMKGKPNMKNVIEGKLDYLKMVKGAENPLYLKLRERLNALADIKDPLERILDIWENEGLEKAMVEFNKFKNEK